MAVNEIQIGRYNSLLHKLLAMKEGAPSPILAPEIIPVVVLENDRPEWRFLEGVILRAGGGSQAAGGAGTVAMYGLRNPVGSNALLVVERVFIGTTTISVFTIQTLNQDSALTAANFGFPRDNRVSGAAGAVAKAGVGICVGGSAATGFTNAKDLVSLLVPANVTSVFDLSFVLQPGTELIILCGTANLAFRASFAWSERSMEPSETR